MRLSRSGLSLNHPLPEGVLASKLLRVKACRTEKVPTQTFHTAEKMIIHRSRVWRPVCAMMQLFLLPYIHNIIKDGRHRSVFVWLTHFLKFSSSLGSFRQKTSSWTRFWSTLVTKNTKETIINLQLSFLNAKTPTHREGRWLKQLGKISHLKTKNKACYDSDKPYSKQSAQFTLNTDDNHCLQAEATCDTATQYLQMINNKWLIIHPQWLQSRQPLIPRTSSEKHGKKSFQLLKQLSNLS